MLFVIRINDWPHRPRRLAHQIGARGPIEKSWWSLKSRAHTVIFDGVEPSLRRRGTDGSQTLRWSKWDSNHWSLSVNELLWPEQERLNRGRGRSRWRRLPRNRSFETISLQRRVVQTPVRRSHESMTDDAAWSLAQRVPLLGGAQLSRLARRGPLPSGDSLRIQLSSSMRSAATKPSGWSSITWCLASGTSTTGARGPIRDDM